MNKSRIGNALILSGVCGMFAAGASIEVFTSGMVCGFVVGFIFPLF